MGNAMIESSTYPPGRGVGTPWGLEKVGVGR